MPPQSPSEGGGVGNPGVATQRVATQPDASARPATTRNDGVAKPPKHPTETRLEQVDKLLTRLPRGAVRKERWYMQE